MLNKTRISLKQEDAKLADLIKRSAETFFAVPFEDIMKGDKSCEPVFVRDCCFKVYSELTRCPSTLYEEAFNGMIHRTTIQRCGERIKKQIRRDPRFGDILGNFRTFVECNLDNTERGYDEIAPAWTDRAERLRHIREVAGLSVIKSILVEDCGEPFEMETF